MLTATYSPEDNKLRLYSSERLDPGTYEQVRGAGFVWAAKQGLFVTPAWTPERADLLEQLAGEIGDEDTSLVERAEERSERFEGYQENRAADAVQAQAAVEAIAGGIPLGQPILVGHHSERHARKDAERIENGMRKAVKMWDTAKYWQDRAAGALRHAKHKEKPDVRSRRIKTLEADKRKQERTLAEAQRFLTLWANDGARMKRKDGGETTFLQRALAITNRDNVSKCFPVAEYPRPEGVHVYEGPMCLWSALGGSEHSGGFLAPEQARDIAEACHRASIDRAERWIAHLSNRLTYERALLAESGGTIADQVKPELGGAVKCWVGPGWREIQKVNRVSVTVLDNWGNGGRDFPRTVKLDKLTGIMSKADFEALKAGQGTATAPEEPARQSFSKPEAGAFENMKETLRAGIQVISAPQLFPTPAHLAARMIEESDIHITDSILEPSAGTGSLVWEILQGRQVARLQAVEINPSLCDRLRVVNHHFGPQTSNLVECADFLECTPEILGTFHKVLMNPPFSNGQDIQHIEHALKFLRPGGRLVAICANGPRQNAKLRPIVEAAGGTWEVLPPGTFADQGTNVNTVLLALNVA